ncbi:hypothetical protein M8J76_014969 [Diaphorina citri]|nr:hypothetical protein M8J76_014969 [Diaphorina citri]
MVTFADNVIIQEALKAKIKSILPTTYEGIVTGADAIEDESFSVTLRLPIATKNDVLEWFQAFQKSSCSTFRTLKTFPENTQKTVFKESDRCIYCQDEEDTPKHMFFQCDRWRMKRTTCWETLGAVQTEQTIIAEMIKDKTRWNCASNFISEIVKNKKMDTQRLAAQADARPTTPQ